MENKYVLLENSKGDVFYPRTDIKNINNIKEILNYIEVNEIEIPGLENKNLEEVLVNINKELKEQKTIINKQESSLKDHKHSANDITETSSKKFVTGSQLEDIKTIKSKASQAEVDAVKKSGDESNKILVDALISKKVSASTRDSIKTNVNKVNDIKIGYLPGDKIEPDKVIPYKPDIKEFEESSYGTYEDYESYDNLKLKESHQRLVDDYDSRWFAYKSKHCYAMAYEPLWGENESSNNGKTVEISIYDKNYKLIYEHKYTKGKYKIMKFNTLCNGRVFTYSSNGSPGHTGRNIDAYFTFDKNGNLVEKGEFFSVSGHSYVDSRDITTYNRDPYIFEVTAKADGEYSEGSTGSTWVDWITLKRGIYKFNTTTSKLEVLERKDYDYKKYRKDTIKLRDGDFFQRVNGSKNEFDYYEFDHKTKKHTKVKRIKSDLSNIDSIEKDYATKRYLCRVSSGIYAVTNEDLNKIRTITFEKDSAMKGYLQCFHNSTIVTKDDDNFYFYNSFFTKPSYSSKALTDDQKDYKLVEGERMYMGESFTAGPLYYKKIGNKYIYKRLQVPESTDSLQIV